MATGWQEPEDSGFDDFKRNTRLMNIAKSMIGEDSKWRVSERDAIAAFDIPLKSGETYEKLGAGLFPVLEYLGIIKIDLSEHHEPGEIIYPTIETMGFELQRDKGDDSIRHFGGERSLVLIVPQNEMMRLQRNETLEGAHLDQGLDLPRQEVLKEQSQNNLELEMNTGYVKLLQLMGLALENPELAEQQYGIRRSYGFIEIPTSLGAGVELHRGFEVFSERSGFQDPRTLTIEHTPQGKEVISVKETVLEDLMELPQIAGDREAADQIMYRAVASGLLGTLVFMKFPDVRASEELSEKEAKQVASAAREISLRVLAGYVDSMTDMAEYDALTRSLYLNPKQSVFAMVPDDFQYPDDFAERPLKDILLSAFARLKLLGALAPEVDGKGTLESLVKIEDYAMAGIVQAAIEGGAFPETKTPRGRRPGA